MSLLWRLEWQDLETALGWDVGEWDMCEYIKASTVPPLPSGALAPCPGTSDSSSRLLSARVCASLSARWILLHLRHLQSRTDNYFNFEFSYLLVSFL